MMRAPLVVMSVASLVLVSTVPESGPPQAAAPTVFFGNLHSHTGLSDGSGTPAEAYEHARDVAGLDFLAITEHNHESAGDIARNTALYTGPGRIALIPTAAQFTEAGRFIALYGQEFSTISKGNHVNVIDAPAVIDVSDGFFRDLLDNWLPAHLDTTGQEPLLLLNHPATSSSPRDLEYGIDDYGGDVDRWRAALDPRAQLINIMNGPSHRRGTGMDAGRPSESEFRRYLNLGLHVAPTADQDNHKRNWGDATDARTGVVAETLTKSALLGALRQRRVYATEDRNLRLTYTVNGSPLGSIIAGGSVPSVGDELTLQMTVFDDDEPATEYAVEVWSDRIGGSEVASVVRTVTVTGDGTHTIPGVSATGDGQYLYLKIEQEDEDLTWTAPVWLDSQAISSADADEDHPFVVTLVIDERAETATISNVGPEEIDLVGWVLISRRGNQRFDQFPDDLVLAPGDSVVVTSGPDARTGAGFVLWTNDNVWNNSGDPGELRDADGHLVASDG